MLSRKFSPTISRGRRLRCYPLCRSGSTRLNAGPDQPEPDVLRSAPSASTALRGVVLAPVPPKLVFCCAYVVCGAHNDSRVLYVDGNDAPESWD